ncbi:hypothetical protein K438DRAFT_1954171 [Mycena galopus ATCC 62051]|nr:hypothetical protein K438DRAFT_1954171 [Mycena galopus ATCC 62051]
MATAAPPCITRAALAARRLTARRLTAVAAAPSLHRPALDAHPQSVPTQTKEGTLLYVCPHGSPGHLRAPMAHTSDTKSVKEGRMHGTASSPPPPCLHHLAQPQPTLPHVRTMQTRRRARKETK